MQLNVKESFMLLTTIKITTTVSAYNMPGSIVRVLQV